MIDVTAQAIYDSLPDDLQLALAVAVTEPEHKTLGSEELRHIARHLLLGAPLDSSVPEILDITLYEWMVQQSRLQDQARSIYVKLVDKEWIDLEGGSFPGWYTTRWAKTLTQPWDERLAEAVLEAENYLSSLT